MSIGVGQPPNGPRRMTDSLQTASSNGAGADIDAAETSEWLEAVDAVVEHDGPDRARQILARAVQRAQLAGSGPIASITTPYVNTIPAEREAKQPLPATAGGRGLNTR